MSTEDYAVYKYFISSELGVDKLVSVVNQVYNLFHF